MRIVDHTGRGRSAPSGALAAESATADVVADERPGADLGDEEPLAHQPVVGDRDRRARDGQSLGQLAGVAGQAWSPGAQRAADDGLAQLRVHLAGDGRDRPSRLTWTVATGSCSPCGPEPAAAEVARGVVQRGVRSGFVTMVGRPNVGKSSLVNAICGEKVSIVSDKPQTTRHRVRGVLTRPDAQLVFVDTPGLHKPVTALGRKVNATAIESVGESDAAVDVVCLVLDATAPFGDGDRWVAGHLDLPRSVVVVNKIDRATPPAGARPSWRRPASSAPRPTSRSRRAPARACPALVEHLVARLPEGPAFFPDDTVRDVPEEQWVAELVREQLLAVTRDELPYSIATRVSEWEGNRITVEIIVERESQKGMVIGRGGQVLKQVGQRARAAAPRGHVPGPAGQGRQGLAAPARPRRPPVLTEPVAQVGPTSSSTAAVSTGAR